MKYRLVLSYILMLLVHQAHIYEEILGHYFLIGYMGDQLYLIGNWLLFSIPLGLLYLVIRWDKKWVYYLSIIYVVMMMFQGIEHILMSFVDDSLFVVYSGEITGLAIYIVGIPLVYYLYMNIERVSRQDVHLRRYQSSIRI